MSTETPNVQLIVNLVIVRDNQTLLVRYDTENEAWWLPGGDLEPYEQPEAATQRILKDLGLEGSTAKLARVDSFRGRRGWHVVIHYRVEATQSPVTEIPAHFFALENFPRTVHGRWERETVDAVLAAA
jgi:ADP-ribose pyrophosphatase YjhB (NUDIX family)